MSKLIEAGSTAVSLLAMLVLLLFLNHLAHQLARLVRALEPVLVYGLVLLSVAVLVDAGPAALMRELRFVAGQVVLGLRFVQVGWAGEGLLRGALRRAWEGVVGVWRWGVCMPQVRHSSGWMGWRERWGL
ncbi:MAG: hypothetical protein M1829_004877 [Trizodia sp. TS-e1964]|nr:MAG: hypothetical protein M1829_004877 [Trizodia sp. TS-e1964]